ncbi:MAG TPA: DUF3017 domain-containing protein [Nocardioidaceae bacterium]|jgi:hypothetical protein|nr:DUF3017 domain-containing protein [Nocardioidaceae bacterium]
MNPTRPRNTRLLPGTVVFALEVTGGVLGLAILAVGPWRLGIGMLGGVLLLGSLARIVLPERHSGLLRVRRATSDVLATAAMGSVLLVLAYLIPDRPPLP